MVPARHLVEAAGGRDHAPGPHGDTGAPQHTPPCGAHIQDHPQGQGPGPGTATNSTAGHGADPRRHLAGIGWALG